MVKGTFPSTELVKLPLLHNYLKKVSINLTLQGYRDYIRRKTISFMREGRQPLAFGLTFFKKRHLQSSFY